MRGMMVGLWLGVVGVGVGGDALAREPRDVPRPREYASLLSGRSKLAALVDAKAGLIKVWQTKAHADATGEIHARLLCGLDLQRELREQQVVVDASIKGELLELWSDCEVRPAGTFCQLPVWPQGEMHPSGGPRFVFVAGGGASSLRMILEFDDFYCEEDGCGDQVWRDVEAAIARVAAEKCGDSPLSAAGLNDLGFAARKRGDHAAATKYYLEAVQVDPRFELALYNLACELALAGRHGDTFEVLAMLRRVGTPKSKELLRAAPRDGDFMSLRESVAFDVIVNGG